MSGPGKERDEKLPPDLQAALNRLDKAVRELADTAVGGFAGRAASFVEQAAAALERELWGARSAGSRRSSREQREEWEERGEGSDRRRPGRRSKRRRHSRRESRRRSSREDSNVAAASRKLYRNPERARIAGVCAGIATYFGAEVWVVRCVAVTGLIFIPSIVFPAYWILYFLLSPPPDRDARDGGGDSPREEDHTSPAPELGPQLSPRRSLRTLRETLTQAELRLRRIESHVTSGQYELQKELNKLAGKAPGNASGTAR